MSLFTATLLLGLFLAVSGALLLLNLPLVVAMLKALPRSTMASLVLFGGGALWFLVLVEGPDKKGLRYAGRTRGNRTVHFECSPRLVGGLAPVRIDRATTSALYGTVEPG